MIDTGKAARRFYDAAPLPVQAQLKRADKSGAELALIIGDDEAARGVAAVKPLRAGTEQQECAFDRLAERIAALLPKN